MITISSVTATLAAALSSAAINVVPGAHRLDAVRRAGRSACATGFSRRCTGQAPAREPFLDGADALSALIGGSILSGGLALAVNDKRTLT